MIQYLPLVGAALLQGLAHSSGVDPDTAATATTALAAVGTASMVAATPIPKWIGAARIILEAAMKVVDLMAFNTGRAKNKE